jgi:hypothetical protein
MSTVITGTGGKRFGRRYPWSIWFARARRGKVTLHREQDFDCFPHGMRQNIMAAARAYLMDNERVSVTLGVDYVTLQVTRRK